MKLVLPTEQYKSSFIEAVKESQAENTEGRHFRDQHYKGLDLNLLVRNFPEYLESESNKSKGKNLPEGWVPETNYWLIDNEEFIGRISVRHHLTEPLMHIGHIGYDIRPSKRGKGYGKQMLKLVLPQVKKIGLDKVLISCFATNVASKRIIEQNGGVLETTVSGENGNPDKLRYWITLD